MSEAETSVRMRVERETDGKEQEVMERGLVCVRRRRGVLMEMETTGVVEGGVKVTDSRSTSPSSTRSNEEGGVEVKRSWKARKLNWTEDPAAFT